MLRINGWNETWACLVFSSDHTNSPYLPSSYLFSSPSSAFEKRREEIYGVQRIHRQAAGLTVDATNAPGFVLPFPLAKAQSLTTADPPHRSLQRNAVNFSRFFNSLEFFASFCFKTKRSHQPATRQAQQKQAKSCWQVCISAWQGRQKNDCTVATQPHIGTQLLNSKWYSAKVQPFSRQNRNDRKM